MLPGWLEWKRETWKGIFIGFELILFILAVSGLFIDIKIGHVQGEYKVPSNSPLTLGKTETFAEEEVAAHTIDIGHLTQSCLNNVSVKSVKPKIGDINGGIFCIGQKITIEDWQIEVLAVRPEKDEAVLSKTRLYSIPVLALWILLVIFFVIHFLVSKLLWK